MNKLNLVRLSKYGLIAEITDAQGGTPHLLLNLPTGRPTGFAAPPGLFESDKFSAATAHLTDADRREFAETDDSCAAAARALLAFAQAQQRIASAAKNDSLTVQGRAPIFAQSAMQALSALGEQYAALLAIAGQLDTQHSTLYAAPTPDTVAATVDAEVRAVYRAMRPGEQTAMCSVLGEPKYARLLLALVRAPLPLNDRDAELVKTAWNTAVAAAKPEEAATLTIARENNDWAQGLVRHLAAISANPSATGAGSVLDRFSAYQLLRPTGGAAVLGFSDAETSNFERRILQAAA